MLKEELKARIPQLTPAASFEEAIDAGPNGWLNVNIAPADWPAFAAQLRNAEDLKFDFLFCITCIDWSPTPAGKTHLTMVYHLTSTVYRHNIVIRSKLDRNDPKIETVSNIWRTAEFQERESYEMFGVNFLNHPDLRLLILPDGWEGKNPMRKDFDDPVNMIRL